MPKSDKHTRSKRKFLITFLIVMGCFVAVRHAFLPASGISHEDAPAKEIETVSNDDTVRDSNEETDSSNEDVESDSIDETESESKEEEKSNSNEDTESNNNEDLESGINVQTPDESVARVKRTRYNPALWSYPQCFPDLQDVQLAAAMRHGITPVGNRDAAKRLVAVHKLVDVSHSPYYRLDSLTHSMPYLVPRAQHLLNTICINFIDSCQSKRIPLHVPIVTSVLRTAADVSSLQRGNVNATTNSCHCYGTTVDIAYNKFFPVTDSYAPYAQLTRWNEQLKRVLGEVLLDLRHQGLCYVKYEHKQACFHLTCR